MPGGAAHCSRAACDTKCWLSDALLVWYLSYYWVSPNNEWPLRQVWPKVNERICIDHFWNIRWGNRDFEWPELKHIPWRLQPRMLTIPRYLPLLPRKAAWRRPWPQRHVGPKDQRLGEGDRPWFETKIKPLVLPWKRRPNDSMLFSYNVIWPIRQAQFEI